MRSVVHERLPLFTSLRAGEPMGRRRGAASWLFAGIALVCADSASAQDGRDSSWNLARVRAVLAPPTPAEIDDVRSVWKRQVAPAADAQLVEHGSLVREGAGFEVSVYRHVVDANEHYTAVFAPRGAPAGTLPILVETRGVRFDYPVRRIADGPFVMSVLGDLLDDFIIVEPCLRGHELQAIATTHRAEGDRRDSWVGAARDVAASVSVAIAHTPAADGERVVSFGVSRGGGVALLHGARDRRVKAVVAMSAPTDWLRHMSSPGEDWGARIQRAAASYAEPTNDRAVQFYEWFLQDREHLADSDVRRRLIGSSPLYFADLLPPVLVHHGSRDSSVPAVNAAALNDRLVAMGRADDTHRVVLHEGAGHLLRGSPAAGQTQAFLARTVLDQRGHRP